MTPDARFRHVIAGIRDLFPAGEQVHLHVPWFDRADEEAVAACVRSSFVSSVGAEIAGFEQELAAFVGAPHAVAVVNGTAALHIALLLAGTAPGDLVITQAFTFIATANAIVHAGARPVFVDIDPGTLGMSPEALRTFLDGACTMRAGVCMHRATGARVRACVPMHTFGMCARVEEIAAICADHGLVLVEDAAEALGSRVGQRHAGTFGAMGTFSFNGNKIITCGGGGAVVCHDAELARHAKHITTQAKRPHPWEFAHDAVGFNHRMPALNAALARSQMAKLPHNLARKRDLHHRYRELFQGSPWQLVAEPPGTTANHWLNTLLLRDRAERDAFLAATHAAGVLTRPAWEPLHTQPMYAGDIRGGLAVTMDMHQRAVSLPSSATP
ncbi:MAG: LegC family aminotransferase [Flavobacteriales bacterium]|jgi:aminotransferase in exopolysaccharide biosynthesis|nr:LegC family aminotransferase [Flavobacteriales bacterium]